MILDEILNVLKKSTDKAYTINYESYTYNELCKFVCNIYQFLLKENKEKKPIVIYGHKEIYMKSAFLACSFAGITYVPVDDGLPNERVEKILEQVKPKLIIGDFCSEKYENISKKQIYQIMDDESDLEINKVYMNPNDIYYIIFTSGSTGVPKGVKVSYKNLDSCIMWLKNIVNIQNGVVLNQANFSFDLSVADMYLSLISRK